MNFTYLLEGPCEPAQNLLQQYEHYIVIVVFSEDMSKFVLENVSFELKSDKNALCWIIQQKHLETAPTGSVLNRLYESVKNNDLYNINHSFLAFASRDELKKNSGGHYIPLFFPLADNEESRKEIIKCAVNKALLDSRPKEISPSTIDKIKGIIPAASFIASLIGLIF